MGWTRLSAIYGLDEKQDGDLHPPSHLPREASINTQGCTQTHAQQKHRHVQTSPASSVQAQALQALLRNELSRKSIRQAGYAKTHSKHSPLLAGVLPARLRSALSAAVPERRASRSCLAWLWEATEQRCSAAFPCLTLCYSQHNPHALPGKGRF